MLGFSSTAGSGLEFSSGQTIKLMTKRSALGFLVLATLLAACRSQNITVSATPPATVADQGYPSQLSATAAPYPAPLPTIDPIRLTAIEQSNIAEATTEIASL